MKQFAILSLILFGLATTACSQSHTYYIDASGNDANSGSSPSAAWRTVNKLNAVAFHPGDQILFKRGGIYWGSINIRQSGEAGRPIVIGAYGSGSRPVITGFTTLNNWTKVKRGVYQAQCPDADSMVNLVSVNDKVQPMGRFPNIDAPNGGYLTFQSHSGNACITDNNYNNYSSADWTGGQIVVRKTYFLLEKSTISSQNNGTFTYQYKGDKHDYSDGFGYFIQNDPRTLDETGEWYFNPSTKTVLMYFGNNSPANYVVKAGTVSNLINLVNVGYVTVRDIQLEGSNAVSINVSGSHDITISNNLMRLSGGIAVYSHGSCPNMLISGNIIDQTQDMAINALGCTNAVIKNNIITNCGIWPGMGTRYVGIFVMGDNAVIEANTVKNIGYNGLQLYGNNVIARNNFISNFTSVLDDGGGIFLSGPQYSGRKLIHNIILNGIGATQGEKPAADTLSEGIYIDDNTSDVTVDGNTVAYVAGDGLKIHNAHNLIIINNTFFDNQHSQILLDYDTNPNGRPIRNIAINHNTMVINRPSEYTMKIESIKDDLDQFGTYDNNTYVQPFASQYHKVNISTSSPRVMHHVLDMDDWQRNTGNDANSKKIELYQNYYQLYDQGPNLYPNGTMKGGLNGTSSFSNKKNFNIAFAPNTMLGNAIEGTVGGNAGDAVGNNIVSAIIGPVQAGQAYIVHFRVAGNSPNAGLDVFLRKAGAPYNPVSNQQTVDITGTPTDHQVLLTTSRNDDRAAIIFNVNSGANTKFWINNISVVKANVSFTNPSAAVKLVYNPTGNTSTVQLNDIYKDSNNVTVGSQITLQPYSSAILFRASVQSKISGVGH